MEMMKMVLPLAWQLECRLLSSHVHARQQTPNLFNLVLFQHGARQQIREKDNSTVQRLTDSRTAYFGCFVC